MCAEEGRRGRGRGGEGEREREIYIYLQGASSSHHPHRANPAFSQSLQRILRDIRAPQPVHPAQQHSRDIQRHVSLPNDDRCLPALQVRVQPPVLRAPVVPPDKVPRGVDSAQRVLTGDAEPPVARGAVREDQRVVVRDDRR